MRGTRGDVLYLKSMLQALESLRAYASVGVRHSCLMPCGKMRSFVGWLFLGKLQSLFPMIYDSAIQVFHGDIWQLFAMFLPMTILV